MADLNFQIYFDTRAYLAEHGDVVSPKLIRSITIKTLEPERAGRLALESSH